MFKPYSVSRLGYRHPFSAWATSSMTLQTFLSLSSTRPRFYQRHRVPLRSSQRHSVTTKPSSPHRTYSTWSS
jgi:hypothetical protein